MCKLRIKDIAKERHITIKEVAKAAGYNRTSSYNQAVARGLKVPQLEDIAALLGVEVADLFKREKESIVCPYCGRIITIKTDTDEQAIRKILEERGIAKA